MDPPESQGANASAPGPEPSPEPELSAAMRAKIERNRQRALMLRQARLANRPLSAVEGGTSAKVSKTIDSGAGFFIEEEDGGGGGKEVRKVVQEPGEAGEGVSSELIYTIYNLNLKLIIFEHFVLEII